MSRWVDAEWLKELYKPYESYNGKELAVPIGAILANIDDAPSIDIEPKHGEWIDRGMRVPSSWVKKCSLCGHETDTWRWCKFCPNCGAKMSNASNASNTLETLETLEKGETE